MYFVHCKFSWDGTFIREPLLQTIMLIQKTINKSELGALNHISSLVIDFGCGRNAALQTVICKTPLIFIFENFILLFMRSNHCYSKRNLVAMRIQSSTEYEINTVTNIVQIVQTWFRNTSS